MILRIQTGRVIGSKELLRGMTTLKGVASNSKHTLLIMATVERTCIEAHLVLPH